MDTYILERLRCDAEHVIKLAKQQGEIEHLGLKGRFRELLIDNILAPWLPPYVTCGTGMIIAAENKKRQSTQDDVILYDNSLCPPVLASKNAPEGVFLFNSVIARIEVKSKLTRKDIRNFITSSQEIASLKFSVQEGCITELCGAFNLLFAFDSDAKGEDDCDFQIKRLYEEMEDSGLDPCNGMVSMLCIPGKGFWKIGQDKTASREWQHLDSADPRDHITWFIGCVSNSCFEQHAKRQGRDPSKGVETGIGFYLDHPFSKAVIKKEI